MHVCMYICMSWLGGVSVSEGGDELGGQVLWLEYILADSFRLLHHRVLMTLCQV